MRFLLLLFWCLTACAQLPVVQYPQPSGANPFCNFDFNVSSASNYMRFIGYSSTNFATTSNPSQLCWSNLAHWVDGGTIVAVEDTSGPIITNVGPVVGLYSVDFTSAGFSGGHNMAPGKVFGGSTVGVPGSNQPNVVIVVCTDTAHSGNGASLFDTKTSNRELARLTTGAPGSFYAGTAAVNTYNDANNGNWYIYTYMFNGANSYLRTNGVKAAFGNPGTGSFGEVSQLIGNDPTGVTGYEGKMWAFLVYSGAMNTNDMIGIERALNCQAQLGYTIPGP